MTHSVSVSRFKKALQRKEEERRNQLNPVKGGITCEFREPFKYYFADFVRKGGGEYPPNP